MIGAAFDTCAITDQQLRAAYLDEPMLGYFRRKLPDVAESDLLVRIEETIKFLFIADECTGAIPVTREIDDVWHYWILQTQEYARLCESLPAGEFIHHCSNDYLVYFDPSVGQEDDLANGVRMLALYVENFGPFVADRAKYWRLAALLMSKFAWSMEELNDWLRIR
jgi:hypothetical protein